jgi:hypothetical protein
MKPQQRTADELREERHWRQRALAAGVVHLRHMAKVSAEVREIDAELSRRGERHW